MADLARGTVLDRPWGRTLAALGLRGLTGQLTVIADKWLFQIAFDQGAVVAASSPLASDAAVRVALTGHLVSSTQVSEITRRLAAEKTRDEIEVLAEAARLGPEQAMRLRRRCVAQRAARTFAVERGDFVVQDEITLPIIPGSELDIRAIIYMGAKSMMTEARLNGELGQLGAWFQLKPEALDDLAQFGFGQPEQAVLEPLTKGAGLAELERPELEQRMVRAVVYALVSCNACNVEGAPRAPAKAPKRQPTPRPVDEIDPATIPRVDPVEVKTDRRPPASDDGIDAPTSMRRKAPTRPPVTPRPGRDEAQAAEVEALIKARLAVLDAKHDHFSLIGVGRDATAAQIRNAYFALARQLHPDRLSALGIPDENRRAQRLFAEVNNAFGVLSDTKRRDEYVSVLNRGGEAAIRREEAQAEEMAHRVLESEEAFRRAELALRRDQIPAAIRDLEIAIELNPNEPDYHAALAWAQFCAAPDKLTIAKQTRSALERAIKQSPRAVTAKFYLARVERMLGKDQEALQLFREVLELSPRHAEATSEIRVLESRLGGKGGGGGLFGKR